MLNIGKAQKNEKCRFHIFDNFYTHVWCVTCFSQIHLPVFSLNSLPIFPILPLLIPVFTFKITFFTLYCLYAHDFRTNKTWVICQGKLCWKKSLFPAVFNNHLSQGLLEALPFSRLGYLVALSYAFIYIK